MKPKTMILMVIAIVCGLGASYMTSRLLAERNQGSQESPKVKVLVARETINVGTPLKKPDKLFESKEFTKGSEPKDAIREVKQLKDKFLKRNLRKGDFVTPKDIDSNQTILPIPDGMQAVGLKVNMESGASGFATLPGSKVDIQLTVRGNNNEGSQTLFLLQNVLVLAADTSQYRKEDKAAMPASVVTVALNPVDVAKVNLAKQAGTLSLSLRRGDDETSVKDIRVTLKDLLNPKKKEEKPEPIFVEPPKPEPKPEVKPEPKPEPQGPKFERYVIKVREGKKVYDQEFWFDEKGNRVPDAVVRKYQSEGQLQLFTPEPAPNQPDSGGQESPEPETGPAALNDPQPGSSRGAREKKTESSY